MLPGTNESVLVQQSCCCWLELSIQSCVYQSEKHKYQQIISIQQHQPPCLEEIFNFVMKIWFLRSKKNHLRKISNFFVEIYSAGSLHHHHPVEYYRNSCWVNRIISFIHCWRPSQVTDIDLILPPWIIELHSRHATDAKRLYWWY